MYFPDPIEHYGPQDGHFVFCSLCCVASCKASAPFAARLVFLLAHPKTFDYIPSLHAKEDNKVDGQYSGKLITMLPEVKLALAELGLFTESTFIQ